VKLKRGAYALGLAGLLAAACGKESAATTAAPAAGAPAATTAGNVGKIERIDPALDALVAPTAAIEKVAGGFKFTEAQTAIEGLEQAITLLPDLIVLDFGLDGELVARLRANVATSAIPIIALTDVCRLKRSES